MVLQCVCSSLRTTGFALHKLIMKRRCTDAFMCPQCRVYLTRVDACCGPATAMAAVCASVLTAWGPGAIAIMIPTQASHLRHHEHHSETKKQPHFFKLLEHVIHDRALWSRPWSRPCGPYAHGPCAPKLAPALCLKY